MAFRVVVALQMQLKAIKYVSAGLRDGTITEGQADAYLAVLKQQVAMVMAQPTPDDIWLDEHAP